MRLVWLANPNAYPHPNQRHRMMLVTSEGVPAVSRTRTRTLTLTRTLTPSRTRTRTRTRTLTLTLILTRTLYRTRTRTRTRALTLPLTLTLTLTLSLARRGLGRSSGWRGSRSDAWRRGSVRGVRSGTTVGTVRRAGCGRCARGVARVPRAKRRLVGRNARRECGGMSMCAQRLRYGKIRVKYR